MQSIIVYPGAFSDSPRRERYSIFGHRRVLIGQAWYHSPIVLSWRDVLRCGRNESQGSNVVLHEFAHHLDGLDGDVDGSPPLTGQKLQEWYRVAEAEYRRLVGNALRGEATILNYYGATNLVEFFAVATECFFERPQAMCRQHGELYAILRDFYRQDPAAWLPDAKAEDGPSDVATNAESAEEDAGADPADWASETVDELFTKMVVYMNAGQYEMAERAASRTIERDPADVEVYQHRAQARGKLGKFAEALQDCEKALAIEPDDLDTYRARAAALIGLQQYEQAEEDLDRVLANSREDAEAFYLHGLVAAEFDQYERAVSDFSRSLWKRPLNADAHYHRGLAYRQLGRLEEAEADRQKAFDLDPEVDRPIWLRKNRK